MGYQRAGEGDPQSITPNQPKVARSGHAPQTSTACNPLQIRTDTPSPRCQRHVASRALTSAAIRTRVGLHRYDESRDRHQVHSGHGSRRGTDGKVTVTNSSTTLSTTGNYRVLPTLTNFTPLSGPVGTVVTILGCRSEANNKGDVQQSFGHLYCEIRFANHCYRSSGSHDRHHRRVHHRRQCRQRQDVHRQLATRLYAIEATGARLGGCAPGILEISSSLGTNPFAVFSRSSRHNFDLSS